MRSKRLFFLPFFSLNVIQNACWSSCYIFRPWYSRQISGEWLRRQVFNLLSLWKWTFLISALLVWKEEEINISVTTLIMDWSNIWGGLVYLSRSLSLTPTVLQTWGVNVCDQIEVSSGSVTGCRNALHGSFIRKLLVLWSCAVSLVEG